MYKDQNICFYPGDFNPPTKYHLNEAFFLKTLREVNQVVILLGESRENEISQDVKYNIFDIYNRTRYSPGISIEKAKPGEGNSFQYLAKFLEKHPDIKCYIALDAKTAKSDGANRLFSKFENVEYQIIKSPYKKASSDMLKAVENDDIKDFMEFLPEGLNQSQIDEIFNMLKVKKEPVEKEDVQDIKEVYTRMFDDGFWKSVLNIKK